MSMTLRELREWVPEIADLAGSTRDAAANHTSSADFYRSLASASTWEGDGGSAARAAMVASATDHSDTVDNLTTAATGMDIAHQQAEAIATTITGILNDAAASPAVLVDETTNQVIPPDVSYLDDETAAQVAAKVADLQARIADVLADGEQVDADLASAIGTATGVPAPAQPATSLQDLLLPKAGSPAQPSARSQSDSAPNDLGEALAQVAGQPSDQPITPPAPPPLDPVKVEQFKALARQEMQRAGVPADQIEARLDAMVAAAQRPLPRYVPPKPEAMPPPGFGEGFADRWFETEQGIKELMGQGGPGAPGVLESWRELAVSTHDQLTNPFGAAVDEIQHALNSPSAAYYLGEKAADGAVATPGLIFGGEGALIARAGALDGPGIPDDLIDGPAPTSSFDTPTPLHGDSSPFIGDSHSPDAPTPSPSVPHPLPADSPIFDGYEPTPPGPQFTNPDGGLFYPDDSLPDKPYAIQGTVIDNAQLPAGTAIDRFGYPGGAYLSPDGVPFAERALPPDSATKPYFQYVVADPSKLPPGWRIEESQVAPWFHQPGGGTQYRIIAPGSERPSTQALVDSGFLREVG
ncbi:hypothetical protein A7U43_21945 [Mycobacterium adipatum]|uniref:TNT domain-containing protein n=2 Tax=Mycobacterium adipatum TaxID=1682113 RepID=A0A172URL4_9MYCO|nr:hypothetical protein A7U43_21945 [Mycobacterium adipatum]